MKINLSIFFLLSTVLVLGQPSNIKLNKLLIGFSFSPDFSYRTLQSTGNEEITAIIANLRNESESPKLGYSGGFVLNYNFSATFGIEAGLSFSNKGETVSASNLNFGDQLDSRYGFTYDPTTNKPSGLSIRYNYNYLDIPLRAVFTFGKGKLQFVTSVGVVTSLFMNATARTTMTLNNGNRKSNKSKYERELNPFFISPMVSLGLNWNLNERVNLRIEPTFRYGLQSAMLGPIKHHLWSAGLNLTCYYALK